jgi:hypothetical protein
MNKDRYTNLFEGFGFSMDAIFHSSNAIVNVNWMNERTNLVLELKELYEAFDCFECVLNGLLSTIESNSMRKWGPFFLS